jgi:hypothetical protein
VGGGGSKDDVGDNERAMKPIDTLADSSGRFEEVGFLVMVKEEELTVESPLGSTPAQELTSHS